MANISLSKVLYKVGCFYYSYGRCYPGERSGPCASIYENEMQFIRFYGSLQILSTMSFATFLRHALPTVILLGFRCSINYVDYVLSSNIRSFTSSISQHIIFLFVKLLETMCLIQNKVPFR